MRSFFWSVFSLVGTEYEQILENEYEQIRENEDQKKLHIQTVSCSLYMTVAGRFVNCLFPLSKLHKFAAFFRPEV